MSPENSWTAASGLARREQYAAAVPPAIERWCFPGWHDGGPFFLRQIESQPRVTFAAIEVAIPAEILS